MKCQGQGILLRYMSNLLYPSILKCVIKSQEMKINSLYASVHNKLVRYNCIYYSTCVYKHIFLLQSKSPRSWRNGLNKNWNRTTMVKRASSTRPLPASGDRKSLDEFVKGAKEKPANRKH